MVRFNKQSKRCFIRYITSYLVPNAVNVLTLTILFVMQFGFTHTSLSACKYPLLNILCNMHLRVNATVLNVLLINGVDRLRKTF